MTAERLEIVGYAARFDEVDGGNDLFAAEAFSTTLAERAAGQVKLLWQHQATAPIGVIQSLVADPRGLLMTARIDGTLRLGREAIRLVRSGALDGLSVGFKTRRARHDRSSGVRHLIAVDLWEVSLVTFPMQRGARITRFRSVIDTLPGDIARLTRQVRAAA